MKLSSFVLLFLLWNLLFFFTSFLSAQPKDSSALVVDKNISLEEIMNLPVAVASRNALSLRESPGIITVITEEEIRNLGARDLIDVLRFVPGMEFAQDVQNFVSLGIRGNWASEGKVAVFVDGIAMNEILYATIPFGNHFSVDQIRKIEIIRGPGSAMYGGVAELAVINIITKQSEMNGIQASAMYGQMKNGMGRMSGSLGGGKEFSSGLKMHLKTWYSRANRGDGTYYQQDDATQNFNMIGNHEILNFTVDGGIKYKGLDFNFLVDRYNARQRNGVGEILPHAIDGRFDYYSANIKYERTLSKKFKLTPLYQYTYQLPWTSLDTVYSYSLRYLQRHIVRLEASYDPSRMVNLLAGIQYYTDQADSKPSPYKDKYYYFYYPDNRSSVSYHNYSGYFEALVKTKVVNVTAGARYDKHSLGFDAFVPRFALTKSIQKVHFKLLGARAFRTPYVQNISSYNVRPEMATVLEAELGYQINKKMNITVNVFDISIKDALYYRYEGVELDSNWTSGYYNGESTGTRGAELVARYKGSWGYLLFNYSYYTNAGKNHIEQQAVHRQYFHDPSEPGINERAHMAFAPHKLNALVNFRVTKNLNWNLNVNYFSKRFGYDRITGNDTMLYQQSFPAFVLLNTFINYDHFFAKGFELGVGCYNILNQDNPFLMPYSTQVSAMPGPTREWVLRMKYQF